MAPLGVLVSFHFFGDPGEPDLQSPKLLGPVSFNCALGAFRDGDLEKAGRKQREWRFKDDFV